MSPRLWLWVERAQAALPLLAVALLAAFSWWLVQSSPKDKGPASARQASSAPDYVLHSARVVRVDSQGRLEAVLDGKVMRHYPDTDRVLIDALVLTARNAQGEGLHAVAREGEADQQAEVVTLRGDARVVATPAKEATEVGGKGLRGGPMHFAGEGLRIDTRERVVTSDQAVRLTQDQTQIDAQSMRYTDQTGVTELGGRVIGHYDPPAQP